MVLLCKDGEREERRGEHPFSLYVGSIGLPILTSVGWLAGTLIVLLSGSCVLEKREHFISQENPDTQTYRPCFPNSAVFLDMSSDWAPKDVAKGETDLESPISLPEGPLQSYLCVKESGKSG